MKLPDFYNYIALFLTMRCPYNCSYCINWKNTYKELDPKTWIDFLNRFESHVPITLSGGEPTSYKGFVEIINKSNQKFDLLTNLSFDVKKFVQYVDPSKFDNSRTFAPIRASFHSESMNLQYTLDKIAYLMDNGFRVGLYCVFCKQNYKAIDFFLRQNIDFQIKPLLDNTVKKRLDDIHIYCRTRELIISPEGNIYKCHGDMYKKRGHIDNIKTIANFNEEFLFCNHADECHPCDLKIKRDRFGKYGYCAVEKLEL